MKDFYSAGKETETVGTDEAEEGPLPFHGNRRRQIFAFQLRDLVLIRQRVL